MREEGKRPIWQRFSAFCMIVMFFAIIAGIAVVSIITPKRTISELEKRRLADPPVLTWQSLTSGGFASSLQNYVQDHIAWRDAWIDLYSRVETLLFGKQDINGILLGRDGWMFTEHFELSDENIEQFERNLDEVERFAERYSGQVTLMLVPPAELIYTDMLPNSAPQRDLNALYEEVNRKLANTSCRIVDLREIFNQARENFLLYYKTDHHWTADGAYLAYQAFCDQNDLEPFSLQDHARTDIAGFQGTHYALSRWYQAEADTLSYYDVDSTMTVMNVLNENEYEPGPRQPLVNMEILDTLDKYGAFLDGNHGYVEVTGNGEGSILLVKDSYANSFVPYLTDNYAQIGCIDFRDFSFGLDTTIDSKGYDQILLLYGMDGFIEDTRVVYLNRPSVL